jgi:hypothetical protein
MEITMTDVVKMLCSERAGRLLTPPEREELAGMMLAVAQESGLRRGQSLFHLIPTDPALKVALDRRANPAEECEWVLFIDPEGLGAGFDTCVGGLAGDN